LRVDAKFSKIKSELIGDEIDKFMQLAFKINIMKLEELFIKT